MSSANPADGRGRLRRHATTSGLLLAAAGLPLALLPTGAGGVLDAPAPWIGGAAAVVLALLAAALVIPRRLLLGQALATLAALGMLALAGRLLVRDPLLALVVLIAATAGLAVLWEVGAPLLRRGQIRRRPLRDGQVQGAGLMACALWLVWTLGGLGASEGGTWAAAWSLLASTVLALDWSLASLRTARRSALLLLAAVLAAGVGAAALGGSAWAVASPFAAVALASALLVRSPRRAELGPPSLWDLVLGHPERLFVGTFAFLCALGTALLALPQCTTSGEGLGFLEAAFTSTSAVCVTGLVVRDTALDLTGFGQLVVLLLIQVGGLGIMTFSTTALWAFRRRLSIRHEAAVASLISSNDRGRLFTTAKRILQLTLAVEAAGAAALTAAFVRHGDALGPALWRGVFTSISAFCNAGFALQSDSLVPYQGSPLVLHVVGALIVVGGLSPLTVFALPGLVRRSHEPVSAQVRLSLVAAALLLVGGFLFFLVFEWSASLDGLSLADRLNNAWFQSVTLRTAGFNSVDVSVVRPATLTLMLLWMFVGGSPGGTAGGVKTTTVAVLLLSVLRAIRGEWTLDVFGKHIPDRTRTKAAVVVSVAIATGVLALLALQLTQSMPTRLAVFEVVSALGTVGLSIGGTAELDGVGRIVIVVCMFVGRVGGVTLLMFLSSRRRATPIGRPEEEMDVG